jgi:hypothetical protein
MYCLQKLAADSPAKLPNFYPALPRQINGRREVKITSPSSNVEWVSRKVCVLTLSHPSYLDPRHTLTGNRRTLLTSQEVPFMPRRSGRETSPHNDHMMITIHANPTPKASHPQNLDQCPGLPASNCLLQELS